MRTLSARVSLLLKDLSGSGSLWWTSINGTGPSPVSSRSDDGVRAERCDKGANASRRGRTNPSAKDGSMVDPDEEEAMPKRSL